MFAYKIFFSFILCQEGYISLSPIPRKASVKGTHTNNKKTKGPGGNSIVFIFLIQNQRSKNQFQTPGKMEVDLIDWAAYFLYAQHSKLKINTHM